MNLTFQDWRHQLLNACDQCNLLEVQKLLIPTVIAPLTLNIDTHRYAMLRETYFLAFRIACEKGHLDLIEDFIHRTPLNVNAPWQKLLPHDFFQGWLFACHGGSLNALHHLISHLSLATTFKVFLLCLSSIMVFIMLVRKAIWML